MFALLLLFLIVGRELRAEGLAELLVRLVEVVVLVPFVKNEIGLIEHHAKVHQLLDNGVTAYLVLDVKKASLIPVNAGVGKDVQIQRLVPDITRVILGARLQHFDQA